MTLLNIKQSSCCTELNLQHSTDVKRDAVIYQQADQRWSITVNEWKNEGSFGPKPRWLSGKPLASDRTSYTEAFELAKFWLSSGVLPKYDNILQFTKSRIIA